MSGRQHEPTASTNRSSVKIDVRDGEIVEDSRLEAERVELTSALQTPRLW